MKRIHTLVLYIGMLCLAFFTACQDHLYYSHYQDMPQRQWDSNDSLYFSIPPMEHEEDVAITLSVRTTASFRYKDIVVRAELLDGDSVISSIPMNIMLYNNRGEEASQGILVTENYSRPQAFHMRANHHYTMRVTHLMRLNPLEEVQSVGIIVEEIVEER